MSELIAPTLLQAHNLILHHWITEEVFSVRWCGIVAFIVASYGLVFWLLDKGRMVKIMFFGALMAVSMNVVDTIGASFVLWSFKIRIFPIVPNIFLVDLTIIPLYYMLVYQYADNWLDFTVSNIITAGIISLIVFPLMAALNVVLLIKWQYPYFLPILVFIASLSRYVVELCAEAGKD